jgi:hypothetical protein
MHMVSDKNTLFQEAEPSAKRKLISVGGCADNPLDLDAGGNTDGKCPCLSNGQTVPMRTPTQSEFVERAAFAMDRQFCRRDIDASIKKDMWSVMEDFANAPGGKDFR